MAGFPRALIVWALLLSVAVLPAAAQDTPGDQPPFLVDLTKKVVLDPTTWTPAGALYTSMRLDWNSSQPLFRSGYVEDNARYTINGLPHDMPVDYSEGNRRILTDALAVLPMSMLHNATNRAFERTLINRFPAHPKLIRTLGWIERVSFASYVSTRLSSPHFRQWQRNQELASRHAN